MSYILQQSDNITVLGDLYNFPLYKGDSGKKIEDKKAILLQIIITVNGKQRIFRTNYDIDLDDQSLKDCESWNNILQFLDAIGYKINFNIHEEVEKMLQSDKEDTE